MALPPAYSWPNNIVQYVYERLCKIIGKGVETNERKQIIAFDTHAAFNIADTLELTEHTYNTTYKTFNNNVTQIKYQLK